MSKQHPQKHRVLRKRPVQQKIPFRELTLEDAIDVMIEFNIQNMLNLDEFKEFMLLSEEEQGRIMNQRQRAILKEIAKERGIKDWEAEYERKWAGFVNQLMSDASLAEEVERKFKERSLEVAEKVIEAGESNPIIEQMKTQGEIRHERRQRAIAEAEREKRERQQQAIREGRALKGAVKQNYLAITDLMGQPDYSHKGSITWEGRYADEVWAHVTLHPDGKVELLGNYEYYDWRHHSEGNMEKINRAVEEFIQKNNYTATPGSVGTYAYLTDAGFKGAQPAFGVHFITNNAKAAFAICAAFQKVTKFIVGR